MLHHVHIHRLQDGNYASYKETDLIDRREFLSMAAKGGVITAIPVSAESVNSPIFLRLGSCMRGPKDAKVGTLKRVLISDVRSGGLSGKAFIVRSASYRAGQRTSLLKFHPRMSAARSQYGFMNTFLISRLAR